MQSIRQNVFETNSSSSHSFTCNIETEGRLETILPDLMGNITLNGGDFSRSEFYISSALEKANAIAAYSFVTGNDRVQKMLEDVLIKQTGASHIVNNIRLQGPDRNTHISSQFIHYISEATESVRDIKNFIFNPNSEINAVFGYDG